MSVPVPEVLLPADRLGRVHFVGIGGAGPVRHRPDHAGPRHHRQRQRRQGVRDRGGAAGPRRPVPRRPRAPSRSTTSTPSWSPPRSARTTPRSSRRRRQGLAVLPRSAALESVMQGRRVVAVAGTHGKTTTTSLLTVALQHCGADPSFAIGGELNESGANAHDGSGDLFVAEADESDGAFLVYSPVRRAGDQRRGRPPRQLRHRGGLPRGLHRLPRTGSTRPGSWSPAWTTTAPPHLVDQARERGLETRRRWASRIAADLRAEGLRFAGSTSTFTVVDRGPPAGRGHAADPGSPLRPRRAGRAGRRAPAGLRLRRPASWAGGLHAAPGAGWSSRARPAGSGSTTATRTIPTRSPATCRRRGRWRRRAASWSRFQPHLVSRTKIFGAGDGRGARRCRRGRGDGRLRRP